MPIFEITDPQTGQVLELTGDSPPTEQELVQIFAQRQRPQQPAQQPAQQVPPAQEEKGFREKAGEAILATPGGPELAEFSSAVSRGTINLLDFFGAKPINAALELAGVDARIPEIGEQEIVKQATTGEFVEPGLKRDILRTSGELVGPAGLGGVALRSTAKAIPTVQAAPQTLGQRVTQQLGESTARQDIAGAALSGAGLETGGEFGEFVAGEEGRAVGEAFGAILAPISGAIVKQTTKSLITPGSKKLLQESAPTIEGLKEAARGVYKKIDDTGAVINPSSVNRLGNELTVLARKSGFNKRIHPKVSAALDEFNAVKDTQQTVTELDTLRKIAQASAKSVEPDEARLGSILVNRIDDFLDNVKPSDFIKGKDANIGAKYKDARQLWRRAKKSELLEEAFDKARNQASGFENGIRVQFRAILNNKSKLRGFTQEEKLAMQKVVRGGTAENLAKTLGKFGFSEGQATNVLMGSVGVAGGAAVGGAPGAVAVPLIGQISRGLAQKMTRNNAEATNLLVRAGNNADEIVKIYLKSTKPKERMATELTELLLRPETNIARLKTQFKDLPKESKKLISDAVFFANFIRGQQDEGEK